MARSDCDSQGIAACSAYELLNLFRTCIALMARLNDYLILDTSQSSQLSLNNYAMCMCVLNNLLGQSDIVLEALEEASIMTDVNPPSMQLLQSSKLSP